MSREQYRTMQVHEIPEGSTAAVLEQTFVTEGAADDLSSATGTKYFHAKTVGGVAVAVDQTAFWTTDGSDGKVRTTMTSDLVDTRRDLICEFEIQGFNGGNLICYPFILRIIKRAKVT